MAHVYAIVFRHGANPSDENVAGGGIKILRPGMVAGCKRIVFPADAIGEGQLGSHLPSIACVPCPGGEPQGVGNDILSDLAVSLRETKQELGKTVIRIRRSAPVQRGNAPVKPKSAAGRAKGSTLGLEVVDPAVVVLQAEAQIVSPFNPAEVGVGNILIVPEGEGIAGVGISEIGPA